MTQGRNIGIIIDLSPELPVLCAIATRKKKIIKCWANISSQKALVTGLKTSVQTWPTCISRTVWSSGLLTLQKLKEGKKDSKRMSAFLRKRNQRGSSVGDKAKIRFDQSNHEKSE